MNLNLLGHEKSKAERATSAPGSAPTGQSAGAGFPQVGLETALLSMLQVHVEQPGNAPLSGDDLRRRLGYEQTSGNSVRLLVGLQRYGLLQRSEKEYVLTRAALHLLETADERAFRAGLQRAASLPPLLRELTEKYGADLDGHGLRDDLKGRRLPENERQTLMKVLRDNQELLGQTARVGALFEQFGKHSPSRQATTQVSAGQWLRTLPGRTANLTLAAVVFGASLIGAALLPGSQQPAIQMQAARPPAPARRQIAPPVAVVSVPPVAAATAAPTTNVQASPPGGHSPKPQTAGTASAGTISTGTAAASGRSAGTFSDTSPATPATAPRSSSTANPGSSARAAGSAQASAASQPRSATRPQVASSTSSIASERAQTAPMQTAPGREARTRPAQAAASPAQTSRRSGAPAAAPQGQATGQQSTQSGVARSTVTATPPSPLAPDSLAPDPLALGRRLADLLYSQRLTLLWKAFSPSVRREWGSFAAFRDYRLGGLETYGAETRVVSEEVRTSGGVTYYVRTATFERGPDHDWTLILGLNPAGQVVEFNIVTAGVLPGVTASAER